MKADKFIQASLRRLGLSVARYPAPNTLPWGIKQILDSLDINLVIDVGAHHGEFGLMLRNVVGYRGRIASFEPHPSSFSVLAQKSRNDSLWDSHQVALGENDGTLMLNVFAGSDMNSVLLPNDMGLQRFSMELKGSEEVRAIRLDSLPLEGAILVKTDTQGHDLKILGGATGLMDQIRAVVIELSVKPIYDRGPLWTEAIDLLRRQGFEPTGLFPVSRDRDHLRVIEFDGVFVRPAQCAV